MKTRCFDHIDLRVKDMDVAKEFYGQFLSQLGFVANDTNRHRTQTSAVSAIVAIPDGPDAADTVVHQSARGAELLEQGGLATQIHPVRVLLPVHHRLENVVERAFDLGLPAEGRHVAFEFLLPGVDAVVFLDVLPLGGSSGERGKSDAQDEQGGDPKASQDARDVCMAGDCSAGAPEATCSRNDTKRFFFAPAARRMVRV